MIDVYIIWLYAIAWVLISLLTFGFYWKDKQLAKKNKFRIKEATLLMLTFLLGSIGAFFGMVFLRHKTDHIKFKIVTFFSLILHTIILAVLVMLYLNVFG
jgi:uncharacterized membrane protein YsdA (DUF1294 family)